MYVLCEVHAKNVCNNGSIALRSKCQNIEIDFSITMIFIIINHKCR